LGKIALLFSYLVWKVSVLPPSLNTRCYYIPYTSILDAITSYIIVGQRE
jgi:hypothetical protein